MGFMRTMCRGFLKNESKPLTKNATIVGIARMTVGSILVGRACRSLRPTSPGGGGGGISPCAVHNNVTKFRKSCNTWNCM